LPLPFTKS